MSKSFKEDLTGRRFGRLTVLEFVPMPDKRNSYWKCKCECGTVVVTNGEHLKDGNNKSCGCLRSEKAREAPITHGLSYTRLHRIWRSMKDRCCNKNSKSYKDYGDRGITVCNEWKNDFQVFYDWSMANGYTDKLSIDRIDVNGNYEPNNCRWTDSKTQSRNMRTNVIIEYRGQIMSISEASELSGIKRSTLTERYYRGDRGEKLFRKSQKNK